VGVAAGASVAVGSAVTTAVAATVGASVVAGGKGAHAPSAATINSPAKIRATRLVCILAPFKI
jgi:hypothetical protein